jgi:hypothetical protein
MAARALAPLGPADAAAATLRARERDELATLLCADGVRAVLLHGPAGAGRTTLIDAALVPLLQSHGIIAVTCSDLHQPTLALAGALRALGIPEQLAENPGAYLTRVVSTAVAGQLFVLAIDDVDQIVDDERALTELAELYARLVSRSGGRVRFLFSCRSERVHTLAALEKRTGSLFTPTHRIELRPLVGAEAATALGASIARYGAAVEPRLPEVVVAGRASGWQPAELEATALAIATMGLTAPADLVRVGGASGALSSWIEARCRAAAPGDPRPAFAAAAALAESGSPTGAPIDELAAAAGVEPARLAPLLGSLEHAGIAAIGPRGWRLASPVLIAPVQETVTPLRATRRRGAALLAAYRGRLAPRRALRRLLADGYVPTSAAERATIARTERVHRIARIALAALPVLVLAGIWLSMRGRAYFDLAPGPGGDRVVVRAGRPGLSAFHWLPSSPGFGEIVADTGLTRAMVAPEAWKRIAARDLGAPRDGWTSTLPTIMAPQLAGLVEYATTGDPRTLEALGRAAREPEDLVDLLALLRPIARGTDAEIALVERALATQSPAVHRAAVALAGAAALRHPGVFRDTLLIALTSNDAELRRIAVVAVRALGPEASSTLFAAALAKDPDQSVRRDLLVEVSASTAQAAPSPTSSAAVLSDPDATPALKERARGQLRRALSNDPATTVTALAALIGEERVASDVRLFAIELVTGLDPAPIDAALLAAVRAAFGSRSESVRAGVLPLYARIDTGAAADLAALLGDGTQNRAMREATALAFGELVAANRDTAAPALERLIRDETPSVRAAAAVAYGKLGRVAQDPLIKLVKIERFEVAVGAAEGLAVTADVGGLGQRRRRRHRPAVEAEGQAAPRGRPHLRPAGAQAQAGVR